MTENNNNNKNDDKNQSLQKESKKEITTPKKVSEPMDIVVGFQSGANRVRQYGGEVEYGKEYVKLDDNIVYGREYVKYRNQNNQLANELKTEFKAQEENNKALENIVNNQKLAAKQENFSQEEEKKVESMLIVFVGIPGSGKSSIVKELANLLNVRYFAEPEEENRNRPTDNDEEFLKNFETQRFLLEATKKLCEEKGIELITFPRGISSIEDSAAKIKSLLEEKLWPSGKAPGLGPGDRFDLNDYELISFIRNKLSYNADNIFVDGSNIETFREIYQKSLEQEQQEQSENSQMQEETNQSFGLDFLFDENDEDRELRKALALSRGE
ncbi:9704_t:CDS:2 [Ambispora gerdemannii]|uniref:9704_t:CDS:1 n=1 Tax=Ambispora gerdemannii TaxID=144530 RepID=A0A9N9FDX1_9GLOM|nr:9704_t:CDS:2 [Ambispora gerdemannii]